MKDNIETEPISLLNLQFRQIGHQNYVGFELLNQFLMIYYIWFSVGRMIDMRLL